jgi:hypothetical protein
MMIRFETWGGYAGLRLRWVGDTEAAPADVAARIADLVAQARLFEGIVSDAGRPDVRDALEYRLAVIDAGREATFTGNDATAPVELRPLLAYLRTLARPAPPP